MHKFNIFFVQIQRKNGGVDILKYATVCADEITDLQVFKKNCKPVFLLLAGGKPTAYVHGANAGELKEMIEREVSKEQLVVTKEERKSVTFEDAVPQSEIMLDEKQAEEDKRKSNMKLLKNSITKKKIFK